MTKIVWTNNFVYYSELSRHIRLYINFDSFRRGNRLTVAYGILKHNRLLLGIKSKILHKTIITKNKVCTNNELEYEETDASKRGLSGALFRVELRGIYLPQ